MRRHEYTITYRLGNLITYLLYLSAVLFVPDTIVVMYVQVVEYALHYKVCIKNTSRRH